MLERFTKSGLAIAILTMSGLTGQTAQADMVFVVDTLIDDATATACVDVNPNDCSLRGAITAANAIPLPEQVTLSVPIGDYLLTINGAAEDGNQTGDLDVLRSLTIQGLSLSSSRVVGGGNTGLDDRLLEVHGAGTLLVVEELSFLSSVPPADLHAVTVGPGAAIRFNRVDIGDCGSIMDGGGGLRVGEGASASLVDSEVSFNAGLQGAGILVQDGTVVITDSEIRNNSAANRGGGIAILDLAAPTGAFIADGSYFFSNVSADGGGIWAGTDTEVRLTDDFFENNRVTIGPSRLGGGIFSRGEVVLDGTTITEGSANAGVAIYIEDTGDGGSQLDMVNSTISGTSTDPGIGAIHMIATIAELLHVTMAENALDIIASQTSLQVTGSLFEGGCQLVIGTIVQTGGTNLGQGS
jgi:hypothetical protein